MNVKNIYTSGRPYYSMHVISRILFANKRKSTKAKLTAGARFQVGFVTRDGALIRTYFVCLHDNFFLSPVATHGHIC